MPSASQYYWNTICSSWSNLLGHHQIQFVFLQWALIVFCMRTWSWAHMQCTKPVFKISAGPWTLTGKIWVGPASFPSLSYINIYKFWQNCAWVRQVSDLILKTAKTEKCCVWQLAGILSLPHLGWTTTGIRMKASSHCPLVVVKHVKCIYVFSGDDNSTTNYIWPCILYVMWRDFHLQLFLYRSSFCDMGFCTSVLWIWHYGRLPNSWMLQVSCYCEVSNELLWRQMAKSSTTKAWMMSFGDCLSCLFILLSNQVMRH